MTHEMQPETMEFSRAVDTPPVPTSPTDGSAAAAPPGRSRLAVAMFAVAALLLIAAVVFTVLGMQAQSDASDQRDRAALATKHRHDLADQQQALDAERSDLEDKVTALPDRYDAVGNAFAGLGDAHDHYVDLLTQSVDLYNAGDTPGSVAVLTNDGAGAIEDLKAKKAATQQAVQDAEDALHRIEERL